jgi:predicted CxxxxCH...CXXCH cytochrome family protein
MMRIKTLFKMISLPLALAALAACSGSNPSASPVVDGSGKHPANWVQQHWVAYRQANGGSKAVSSGTACSECHGTDLAGGISKVSCFSASFNGMSCHANADHTLGHPSFWADPTSNGFHGAAGVTFNGVAVQGSGVLASDASCGLCHATDSNVFKVGSSPSCLSTDPKWGISCHASSPAVKSSGCSSCHGAPANGAARPNRAGSHAAHLALTGVTCATCHSGFGTGTDKHATAVFLNNSTAFLALGASYRAETGGFRYVSGSCSAVSCHGGKQTPAWTGGAITVATDCLTCHQQQDSQAPQYNSFYSGDYSGVNLHQFHLAQTNPLTGNAVFCTDCHLMTDAKHFSNLATPAFETDPGDTIGGAAYTGWVKSTETCTNSCHRLAPATAKWN